jgi:hypothetical protein
MISFNPPLDQTTILNVPFHAGQITLTATVTTGQLDARSTIQIWTDIPNNSQPPSMENNKTGLPALSDFKEMPPSLPSPFHSKISSTPSAPSFPSPTAFFIPTAESNGSENSEKMARLS